MQSLVKINLYAGLKDYFGQSQSLEISPDVTLGDLLAELIRKNSEATALLSRCRFAVNQEFVNESWKIKDGDIIDILPPSSGG